MLIGDYGERALFEVHYFEDSSAVLWWYFVRGWGFDREIRKAKYLKKSACATSFWGLVGCSGCFMVGV